MNFKIRVVENIGEDSQLTFGVPGTINEVTDGVLQDIEGFKWYGGFGGLNDINEFFNQSYFKTVFELVEEEQDDKE